MTTSPLDTKDSSPTAVAICAKRKSPFSSSSTDAASADAKAAMSPRPSSSSSSASASSEWKPAREFKSWTAHVKKAETIEEMNRAARAAQNAAKNKSTRPYDEVSRQLIKLGAVKINDKVKTPHGSAVFTVLKLSGATAHLSLDGQTIDAKAYVKNLLFESLREPLPIDEPRKKKRRIA